MKKLKLLFFVFILFIFPNVFADTSYDMTSRITSPVNYNECGAGSYTGVELNGATNCWNTNTRYQGTLNRIYFNLPAPTGTVFESDTSYRLTLNMATQDWRNNFGTVVVSPGSSYTNNFVDTFTFVSMKQVNITFTVPYGGSTSYQSLYVNLPAKNSSSLITGTSNWNLSNVTLTKLTSGSSGGSTTPSGPSTSFDDTAIINNSNENTQNVINNNNQNTQDIINNSNENTNILNDSINDNCKNTTLTLTNDLSSSLNSYLDSNGDLHILSGASVSTYIKVRPNTTYTLKKITGGDVPTGFSYCLYNANKSRYRCGLMPTNQNEEVTISADSYTTFIRFSMRSYLVYQVKGYICNDFVSDNLNEVNNSINNSSSAIQGAIQGASDAASSTITNNQDANTNKQIESQNVCHNITSSYYKNNGYLNSSGISNAGIGYKYTDFISLRSSSSIKLVNKNFNSEEPSRICFYTSSNESSFISCFSQSNLTENSYITIPSNANFFRATYSVTSNLPIWEFCTSGNQVLNDSIDNLNDNITNSNVDNNTGTGFFDNFTSQDFGLSQIITIPLNTIQSLTSKSCLPLQVPIPFTNSNITLPCMTEVYENRFSTIYNLWKIVSFGIVAYFIAIDIFHIVKGFKDPESDKVEVLDL